MLPFTFIFSKMEKAKRSQEREEFLLSSSFDNGMLKWQPAVHLYLIYVHIVPILWLVHADNEHI